MAEANDGGNKNMVKNDLLKSPQKSAMDVENKVKVICLGDSAVGKSK